MHVGNLNLGNQKYIKEVALNMTCIVCTGDIPVTTSNQKHRLYCGKSCAQTFYEWRKREGLLIYPIQTHWGRQAKKHKAEVHRY